MAELATAGSLVGLISLSVQSCQSLTSYYSAWKSYDEQIGHTHRNLDELRITCENLEQELQRITQYQEPAVQQVVRLIISCRDGINSLRYALEHCQSVRIPDSLTAKIKVCRARALFPFRKQTLQRLEDTVHHIQGNLGSALQILQLHISAEQAQTLADLARTVSGTETVVHSNQTAIQALSSPIQAINQAFPLIKQQNDATAITLKTVHKEAHDSRQEARQFRDKALMELTKMADRVDSSPKSLERSIATSLNRHGAEMSQLKYDLQYAHSQDTNKVVAKLETIEESVKGIQLGLISKPSLMRSVFEENDRLENLPGRNNERREGRLISRDRRRKRYQRCSCKPKHNSTCTEISSEKSYFRATANLKWKFMCETEPMSHHPACFLFASSSSTTVAKFGVKRCGAFLSGAIEASISITRGAGGFSFNPGLQCARVVPANNPAFELVHRLREFWLKIPAIDTSEVEFALETSIQELARLFRDGKASPYDVDLQGNTLLHISCLFLSGPEIVGEELKRRVEMTFWFLNRLAELCVPLNWTNDYNLTFMTKVLSSLPYNANFYSFVKPFALLFDTGAEFANLSTPGVYYWSAWCYVPLRMTMIANSAEFVDSIEDNELSIAIWHRSEQELDKIIRDSPQLINQTNGLKNTPLHLAVGWPYGIRTLLRHGARLNATDQCGQTSLFYAVAMGNSETVSLLMKAGCSLKQSDSLFGKDLLEHAIQYFMPWHVSQEARMDVLDTAISLLAERRRNLQSRLAALSTAVTVNSEVFQDDRVLDEYAQYAECVEKDATRGSDHMPRHASSLLPNCRTVYHIRGLTVEAAEKLWQNGFRDIDVPDELGLTPLMFYQGYYGKNLDNQIEVSSWLIQKGANLHRLQRRPWDYDADPTISIVLPPVISTLHYVAYNIGFEAHYLVPDQYRGLSKRPQQIGLHQISKEARLFVTTVLSDVSYDDCICACSSQGCLASTMMLKSFKPSYFNESAEMIHLLAKEYLIELVESNDPCPDWLVKEIIRFQTFTKLELRHTCCKWRWLRFLAQRDPEEQAEIRDEDHEKIELLETLLLEFEEHRGTQSVISFLKGYWAMRMKQVLRERGHVNREALREIGVILHKEDGKGSDGEGRDEDRNDEEKSDKELGDDDD